MPVIYHACLELILDLADSSVDSWLRPRPLFLMYLASHPCPEGPAFIWGYITFRI